MEMVTQQEKETLEARLAQLIANRPIISKRIAEARDLGDLKENGDYHAAREEQGMQEAEIQRLERRIAESQVVDDSHKESGVVFVGTTVRIVEVRLEGDGDDAIAIKIGEAELFRLVGEATDGTGDASVTEATLNSPFGEALLKSRVGEVIAVRGPRGIKRFEIVEIV